MNFWEQIRNYLQEKVSAESYDNWLQGTEFVAQRTAILSLCPRPTAKPEPGSKPSTPV